MGLFDRDYDREYGYRGNTGYRGGYDRNMGGRDRSWWERTKDKVGMGNDYDRGYGYDRTYGTRGQGATGWGGTTGYGRSATGGYARGGTYGPATGYGATGYDRGYTASTGRSGYADDYGAGYKSRAQTDAGDPFGDRQSGTPIRVMEEREDEGWFSGWGRNKYDRGYQGGYDRSYGQGVGYDAHSGRGTTGGSRRMNAYEGQQRTARGYDRGLRGSAQYAWRETKDETSELVGRDRDRGYRGRTNRGWF